MSITPGWVRNGRIIGGRAFDGSIRMICQVSGGSEEADGNARLIEAAPDLLAACKLALKSAETGHRRLANSK